VKLCLLVENRQVVLMEGANVIGRAPDATIQIDSPSVSRYHARILVAHGEATVEDLGSKNGTSVDGERLTRATRLSDGNVIQVGVIGLTFRIASPMGPTETVPAAGG
jgi:pSer/pThr/pTyr-binding forkhead associated (FHA) protein